MDARFRVRTRSEQELRPQTLQEFQELVQRGEITREDLVHDALTGEWAPAWAHPVYRLVTDPLVTFVGDPAPADDMVIVEPRRAMRTEWLEPPEPPPTERAPLTVPLEVPARESRRGRIRVRRGLLLAAGLVVALALALEATVDVSAFRWASVFPGLAEAEALDHRQVRPVSITEEALRAQAWNGFVEQAEARRVELGVIEVPEIWLDGRYLAEPRAYREVRAFWHRYLRLVETVHEQEEEWYKGAYLAALDRADVAGPMRSLRLATALADFQSVQAERDALYAQVWELASASLGLDELLVGDAASVRYEPAMSERLSADPVLEAASPELDVQERMEWALDRVMVALHDAAPGARGSREGVPAWLVEGLRQLGPR